MFDFSGVYSENRQRLMAKFVKIRRFWRLAVERSVQDDKTNRILPGFLRPGFLRRI
jgi:hypothetical protein